MAEHNVNVSGDYDMASDFKYFLANMSELYNKYAGRYVVIKNDHVLGVYDDVDTAVLETAKSERIGSFLVQRCVHNIEEVTAHFAGNILV